MGRVSRRWELGAAAGPGGQGRKDVDVWAKSTAGRENSKCKDPEVGSYLDMAQRSGWYLLVLHNC